MTITAERIVTTSQMTATTLNQKFIRVADSPRGVIFDQRKLNRVELPEILEGRKAMRQFMNAQDPGRDLSIDVLESINERIGTYKSTILSKFGRYDENADLLARDVSKLIVKKVCEEVMARK